MFFSGCVPGRRVLKLSKILAFAITMSSTEADHTREPCPLVIISDFGAAFSMGVSVHAVFFFVTQLTSRPLEEPYGTE